MSVFVSALNLATREEKFMRIPYVLASNLSLGSNFLVKSDGQEKFSSNINRFLKDSSFTINGKMRPYFIEVQDLVILESAKLISNEAFDIKDIHEIPESELINVEGIVKEKWMEMDKFRVQESLRDSVLSHVNFEIKLGSRFFYHFLPIY